MFQVIDKIDQNTATVHDIHQIVAFLDDRGQRFGGHYNLAALLTPPTTLSATFNSMFY
jgi:hypothetical protein